jgi:hypothetical protein
MDNTREVEREGEMEGEMDGWREGGRQAWTLKKGKLTAPSHLLRRQ